MENKPSLPSDEPSSKRLPPLLRRAWFGLHQAFRRRLKPLALTPDQFTILRNLVEGDKRGLSQRDLCEGLGSDPNTISSLSKRMEKAGLLERLVHESDKRAYRIRIKSLGRKLYRRARKIALQLQREVLDSLRAQDRDSLLVALETMAETCRKVEDDKRGRSQRDLCEGLGSDPKHHFAEWHVQGGDVE